MSSLNIGFCGKSFARTCGLALACCAMIAAVGCGKGDDRVAVHPVSGKVLVKGQAPVGATVVLTPSKPLPNVPQPRANVQADGSFQASTYDTNDGAPEGEYKVTVIWYKPTKENGSLVPGTQNLVPEQYGSPATTPAVASVKAGANTIPDIIIK